MMILRMIDFALELILIVLILNENSYCVSKIKRLTKMIQYLERRVTIQERELIRMREQNDKQQSKGSKG